MSVVKGLIRTIKNILAKIVLTFGKLGWKNAQPFDERTLRRPFFLSLTNTLFLLL